MKIFFRDTNPDVIAALRKCFQETIPSECEVGDIFSTPVDAVVSPANSFGWMNGGIDLTYRNRLGSHVELRLQNYIQTLPFRELLVGQVALIETESMLAPLMIAAPTMRQPGPTTRECVYLAARAAFECARRIGVNTLACPGLGTATGRVLPSDAALAMYSGYQDGHPQKNF